MTPHETQLAESAGPPAESRVGPKSLTRPDGLRDELERISHLVGQAKTEMANGVTHMMPGQACFLADGRVMCRERERGDSRFPYGKGGFNFWAYASGRMHCNDGLFFVFLPTRGGQEPPVAFFAGTRAEANESFESVSLLPVPFLEGSEPSVEDRYAIIGPDAVYYITKTQDLFSAVRVFLDQSQASSTHICFTVYLQNLSKRSLDTFTSAYMNPLCRHQFMETNEDQWFKKIQVDPSAALMAMDPQEHAINAGRSLPPFVVEVNEDGKRDNSSLNHAVVRRAIEMRSVETGHALTLTVAGLADQMLGRKRPHRGMLHCQVCTARLSYVGCARRTLGTARFLRTGQFDGNVPVTVFNDNAVIGDLCRFDLPPNHFVRVDYVLSIPSSADQEELDFLQPVGARTIDLAYQRIRKQSTGIVNGLQMRVSGSSLGGLDDKTFNHFFPLLKAQVALCAETKGFMHPSPNSLIGMRDVFQAIEGHLLSDSEAAKRKILEALGFVMPDGQCPRQYSLPARNGPCKADLREFIDQGAWVISTVYTYLATTGDWPILDEIVGYHRIDGQNGDALEPTRERDSVADHLVRIMDYLLKHRDSATGLVLALYGDWNDALDGLGVPSRSCTRFGNGVSVMASLQVYRNCREMIEVLSRYGPDEYASLIEQYRLAREGLRRGLQEHAVVERDGSRRIVHGWGDNREYLICSFEDSDGKARDGLTSNAFWVLSGLLQDTQDDLKPEILKAMRRLDSSFGLRTFTPGFSPDAPGVGRIAKLPIGTAENGATYVHATTFGIMALFMMDEPEFAWEQVLKILPFAPHQQGISHSPFVMPNAYAFNPELNLGGQNMNDWQTGSSNVLLKTLVRHAFGFRPGFDALRIVPAAWSPFQRMELSAWAHRRPIRIVRTQGEAKERRFAVNGRPAEKQYLVGFGTSMSLEIRYTELSKECENLIEIRDPDSSPLTCKMNHD